MTDSTDVFMVGGFGCYFTIRWYREAAFDGKRHWGKRALGGRRFALDFWHLSLVFENYNTPRT